MPYWKKLFKAWGIYKVDFHKKYRKHLKGKRYKTYIDLVIGDIKKSIGSMNRAQIDECLKDFFRKKEFVCPDIPR
jgi:hypothetical protein